MLENLKKTFCILAFVVAVIVFGFPTSDDLGTMSPSLAEGADGQSKLSKKLRKKVKVSRIRKHQRQFQAIADANGDTRASGTPGYDASADYVVDKLERAGYTVTRQPFTFPFFQELSPPILNQDSPILTEYPANVPEGFNSMTHSGSGDVTAKIEVIDVVLPPTPNQSSTSGCQAADFGPSVVGKIALIQRGACTFVLKAQNAQMAGALGVIIFNEGQTGRTAAINGTLGQPGTTIPVVGASFALGDELAALAALGPVEVRLAVDAISEFRASENIIADTPVGLSDQTVVVGAHLDSVMVGPGINDNGSGSATILEIALQLAKLGRDDDDDDDDGNRWGSDSDDDDDDDSSGRSRINNRIRFAWWGGSEAGLLGSTFYVNSLTQMERDEIALNLNFESLGSPNFVRFVYDGDGSDTPLFGPPGSDIIEQVFINYFAEQGLAVEPTPLDGRSDYGPFIAPGIDIPAGGLFGGAEVRKTQELADIYGGMVGEPFDPCYHLACDTFDNNSNEALDQLSDAAAHAVAVFAQRPLSDLPLP